MRTLSGLAERRQAQNFYDSLTGKFKEQMANAFDRLAKVPLEGKLLKGDLKGYWSYRVGIHRIIYTIRHHEVIIEVLRIQHRKEVYEKFRR